MKLFSDQWAAFRCCDCIAPHSPLLPTALKSFPFYCITDSEVLQETQKNSRTKVLLYVRTVYAARLDIFCCLVALFIFPIHSRPNVDLLRSLKYNSKKKHCQGLDSLWSHTGRSLTEQGEPQLYGILSVTKIQRDNQILNLIWFNLNNLKCALSISFSWSPVIFCALRCHELPTSFS